MKRILALAFLVVAFMASAALPQLHVDGRYLKDPDGNIVNLHGFAQTYSPWFNERGTKWTNYDVDKCLQYNKSKIDGVLAAGWKMTFLRLHMDPYWSNTPGVSTKGENDISAFDFNRFKNYLNSVFIPMAEYAVSRGLYVVMRPPGVCPEKIAVGDDYHKYLKKVWGYVSTQARLKNHPNIMFELANEPIQIKGTDGNYGSNTDACNKALTDFFQEIVDLMRGNGCNNILWIPGTGYQSQYAGFAKYPVKGDNIGYAVHVYPGWYGSDALEPSHELGGAYGGGYTKFAAGWAAQIQPCADFAPIMVTEMDWAPSAYDSSWGKSITGTMLNEGFGANFKLIADNTGNVSWLLFTGCDLIEKFTDVPGAQGNYTFLNDPAACPWPIYHWFKDYAGEELPHPSNVAMNFSTRMDDGKCVIMTGNSVGAAIVAQHNGYQLNLRGDIDVSVDDSDIISWADGNFTAHAIGETSAHISYEINGSAKQEDIHFVSTPFPFVTGFFNPSIWESGSFDPESHIITTGKYGFAGWKYPAGLDLSKYRYLVAELDGANSASVSFRAFDTDNYWSDPVMVDFGNSKKAVIDLQNMKSNNGRVMDPSHIYIVGFWSMGGKPFTISKVYPADDLSGIDTAVAADSETLVDVYTIAGVKVKTQVKPSEATLGLAPGLYIAGGRKIYVRP